MPPLKKSIASRALLLLALLVPAGLLASPGDTPSTDLAGASDHPLISRFTGSLLVGYSQQDWAASELPGAGGVNPKERRKFIDPVAVEGKRTRLFYLGPPGKSALEIFRNQQQALQAAGFKTRFSCELKPCTDPYFALEKNERGKGMDWAKGYLVGVKGSYQNSRWSLPMAITHDEGRMLVGTLSRGGSAVQILLYTSLAYNEYTDRAASYLEIIEPKAMPTGQVTVDAKAIAEGLQSEGKVTLSGLFFDTGKSELKPESAAQLEAMSQLLQSQAQVRVFIVGHTDNIGSLEANQALSQARAQAVVAALTAAPYRVDAKRLMARGVGPLAPQAPNADEAGRARNRRVEMVLQ